MLYYLIFTTVPETNMGAMVFLFVCSYSIASFDSSNKRLMRTPAAAEGSIPIVLRIMYQCHQSNLLDKIVKALRHGRTSIEMVGVGFRTLSTRKHGVL